MFSNEDSSDAGKSLHYNKGNKGSVCTVRVGSRSLPLYPLVIVCLGLLNIILILTAIVIGIYCSNVGEVPTHHQITAQALFAEVKQLQLMQTEAFEAHDEAKQALEKELKKHEQLRLQLEQNSTLNDDLQRQFETLVLKRATLKSTSTDIRESCGRCLPGWHLFNTTCYYHSLSGSNSPKNWEDSRADCISRGANLTMIDTWEEQQNLFEFLPKLDPSIRPWWSKPGGIWIGLSDIHSEGNWVWLNNVTQRGGYWIPGEPNNYRKGQHTEDCAAIINMRNPQETWFDANCHDKKEWLCEMEPN